MDEHDKLVEKVARAIWRASALNSYGARDLDAEWDSFADFDRQSYCDVARAALSAIQEAGYVVVTNEVTPRMLQEAWGAWRSRHGGRLGPGPGFKEAIEAAIRAGVELDAT